MKKYCCDHEVTGCVKRTLQGIARRCWDAISVLSPESLRPWDSNILEFCSLANSLVRGCLPNTLQPADTGNICFSHTVDQYAFSIVPPVADSVLDNSKQICPLATSCGVRARRPSSNELFTPYPYRDQAVAGVVDVQRLARDGLL